LKREISFVPGTYLSGQSRNSRFFVRGDLYCHIEKLNLKPSRKTVRCQRLFPQIITPADFSRREIWDVDDDLHIRREKRHRTLNIFQRAERRLIGRK